MPCWIDSRADVIAMVSFTNMLPSVLTVMRESKERMRSSLSWAVAGANAANRKHSAAKKFFMEFCTLTISRHAVRQKEQSYKRLNLCETVGLSRLQYESSSHRRQRLHWSLHGSHAAQRRTSGHHLPSRQDPCS